MEDKSKFNQTNLRDEDNTDLMNEYYKIDINNEECQQFNVDNSFFDKKGIFSRSPIFPLSPNYKIFERNKSPF
jgi:cytidylate kinase